MCNFPDIQDYFEKQHSAPQPVLVLSRQFSDEQVDKSINTQLYRPVLIDYQEKSRFLTIAKEPTLNKYFLEVEKLGSPVLLEFGLLTLSKYFKEEPPLIDFFLLVVFTGTLSQEFMGPHFDNSWTSKYKLHFRSEEIPHELGHLQFFLYTLV